MTSSEPTPARRELLERARRLLAEGYRRASVVDAARAAELSELYEETGQEVVVVQGAVPDEGQDCQECLADPGLATLFTRRRTR